jgi:hypothetical protein
VDERIDANVAVLDMACAQPTGGRRRPTATDLEGHPRPTAMVTAPTAGTTGAKDNARRGQSLLESGCGR